jgi:alpha-D-ribose 1-methylphosphonate 5-triphosphate synthase subunit PhnH
MVALDLSGDATALGRGFPEPVLDAQHSFRALLGAMAEPGTLCRLEAKIEQPAGLTAGAAIVLLTLADHDTPVWFAPALGLAGADYVRFYTGAPIARMPGDARLAVIDGGEAGVPLSAFPAGEDRYPDRSATIVVQCLELTGGPAVSISGPGIRGSRSLAPAGLRADFWQEVAVNHARYPLGVDLVLVAAQDILAIPRSTAVLDRGGR